MDTLSFFEKILPSQGLYVLACFKPGSGKPSHINCKSLAELTAAAQRLDARGVQVFQACASFKEPLSQVVRVDGKDVQANRTRKADNAAFVRAQWLDIDVGPNKDYPTRKEALLALAGACRTLRIPAPMLVSSGRGIHAYWTFEKDLPAAQARILSATVANALNAIGFKHDQSRTADLASILRPVGSHWRKDGEVEVTLLRDAPPVSAKSFIKALAPYIQRKAVEPSNFGTEWGTGIEKTYPPSSATRIIQFCPSMKYVVDEGGDVPEPHWRLMLGLVKHTVEGEAKAHEWSQGHPQYDFDETQQKLDNWTTGPSLCEKFAEFGQCEGCRFRGKVKSPIQLGYTEDAPAAPTEEPKAPATAFAVVGEQDDGPPLLENVDQYACKSPNELPFWVAHYRWSGVALERRFTDEDGVVNWVPFCNTLFYPYLRYPLEDGTAAIKVCARLNTTQEKWRKFEVQAKTLAENQTFATAMGAYETYAVGKGGKEHMRQYMQDMLHSVMNHNIETTMHNTFGWTDNGFVMGTSKITTKGVEPVYLNKRIPQVLQTDFGTAGTARDWADLINTIYNRPGAEPYQFLIAAAFGAPLIKLLNNAMWHGIPIALTGQGGLGKTTTCKVACSMYGDPSLFTVTANENGSTMNALIQRVALFSNLPIVLDEMTGRSTQDFGALMYALSNGKPKGRLRADGSIINEELSWDTISFVTGNTNITGLLSTLERNMAEATQLRCFEISLPEEYNAKVFGDINAKDIIETQLLGRNYGVVGREYLQYVLKHREKIANSLARARAKVNPTSHDETRERFYLDLMVTALLGAQIAQKLGYLNFDLKALQVWAVRHIRSLRNTRSAATLTPEDHLQDFLASLNGRTVVTKWFRDGRVHRDKTNEFVDESRLRNPIARHAVEDRVFMVTTSGLAEWCKERGIAAGWLKDELDKRGYVVPPIGKDLYRDRITKGTNIAGAPAAVLKFEYDRIADSPALPKAETQGKLKVVK